MGGGQSGAEVVRHILADKNYLPSHLTWTTRRYQFLPVDYSTFVIEFFFPNYVNYFRHQSVVHQKKLLDQQTLASDGISENVLLEIYKQLYSLEYLEGKGRFVDLYVGCNLMKMSNDDDQYHVLFQDQITNAHYNLTADIIILCTGYHWKLPIYLRPINSRLELREKKFIVNDDYSIVWDGPNSNKIFIQNGARHSHGIADPNLSLIAWRSARIINGILGKNFYDISDEQSAIDWNTKGQCSYEQERACNE